MSKQRKHQTKYASVEFEYRHGEFLVEITPVDLMEDPLCPPEVIVMRDGKFQWAQDGHFSKKMDLFVDAVRFSIMEKELLGQKIANLEETISYISQILLGILVKENGVTGDVLLSARSLFQVPSLTDKQCDVFIDGVIDDSGRLLTEIETGGVNNPLFAVLSEIADCSKGNAELQMDFHSQLSGFES